MPIWNVAAIHEEPSVVLRDWRVYEAHDVAGDGVSRHFVGTKADTFSGRVSSDIKGFDAVAGKGITRSGRVYELKGPPGESSDGEYVWDAFCRINRIPRFRDITADPLFRKLLMRAGSADGI